MHVDYTVLDLVLAIHYTTENQQTALQKNFKKLIDAPCRHRYVNCTTKKVVIVNTIYNLNRCMLTTLY